MGITQVKGDLATAQAIASFTRLGYNVAVPITESASYDLIVEKDCNLYRVQVKYCGAKDNDLNLKRVHTNGAGYVVKFYSLEDFDWLYVYRADGVEFLFTENTFAGRTTVRVNKECDYLHNKEAAVQGTNKA